MTDPAGTVQVALTEFAVAADDYGTDEKSYPWAYYRLPAKMPNGEPNPRAGYITMGPAWPSEYKRSRKKGLEPLDNEYGEFQFPFDKRYNWRPHMDPYWLILAKGGAREFPLQQVLEHGWDRKLPYKGVVFPQLEGYALPEDVVCPVCFKKMPHLDDAKKLLQAHVTVAHREVSQSQQLASSLTEARQQLQSAQLEGPLTQAFQVFASAIQQLSISQVDAAERQRATDERLALLLEKVLGAPAGPAVEQPAEVPPDLPRVEPEAIVYSAPDVPGAPDNRKKK